MAFRKLFAFLCIAAAASASTLVLHESRPSAPAGFVRNSAAPAQDTITLRFALASNNVAGLQQKLLSISTPGSADFRRWLSKDEVKSYVQPSAETVAAFNNFASANGLKPSVVSPNGDWVSLSLPVSQANKLFGATYELFTHAQLSTPIMRTLSISLPSELVGHVDVITPSTQFIEPNTRFAPVDTFVKNQLTTPAASCNTTNDDGVITPKCLQDLYGIPATPAKQKKNSLLVTAYEDQWANEADLNHFLTLLRPDINPNTTFSLLTIDDGENIQDPSEAGIEANLDVQYTTGIATGVPIEFLSVGGDDFIQSLVDTTTYLDGVDNPPSVMTTSYGANEDFFGLSAAQKICNGYAALGARGISVVFASGDGGVRGGHDSPDQCTNNTFIPVFPASCPFVTSVGATFGIPESGVPFSSGGFSNFFSQPVYQTVAVENFLRTVPKNFNATFNRHGRGFPDVSVQGVAFEIVWDTETGTVGGTSASSPTFASVIALINDRLVAAGKPVLGFLNPFLYLEAFWTFNDITKGHNVGDTCPPTAVAFDAAKGWDPITGWGTPNFPKLLSAAELFTL